MPQPKLITIDELTNIIVGNDPAVLIDARTKQWDDGRRIAKALSLPADTVPQLFEKYLPKKDAQLIVYCGGGPCPLAKILASNLMDHGYTNVVEYAGGIREWADERGYLATTAAAKSVQDCDSVCQI